MFDETFPLAFTAGMVATVNPCGFAMLPAYLGYFLGLESATDERRDATAGLVRALVVGAVVSAGFLVVFGLLGSLFTWGSFVVGGWAPWSTAVIGLALVGVGLAFVAGWQPKLLLPRLDRGGRSGGLGSMFVFGLSYAVASLSCTFGPFTSVVATTFTRESFFAGLATFVAYGLGMALLLMVLTVTLALARQGLVSGLRRAQPFVQRVSGVVMVAMGAYLTWYGVYEIRLVNRGERVGRPVGPVTRWFDSLARRLDGFDAIQAALALALVVAVVILLALLRSGRGGSPRGTAEESEAPGTVA